MHKMLLEHMCISVHVMIVAYVTQCVMYCSVCHLGNLDILVQQYTNDFHRQHYYSSTQLGTASILCKHTEQATDRHVNKFMTNQYMHTAKEVGSTLVL